MTAEHVDVLVVGAGISGIAAGYYLQTRCPTKTFAILEGREAIGGTWDLFRYPGVRSDSDMFTLGYSFRPWPNAKAIADGPSILHYVRETASIYGIDRKIRFHHRVRAATWSSAEARWTVEVTRGPDEEACQFTCSFLFMCTGYYDYDHGYLPKWPGVERFNGLMIHPQQWPEQLDYAGKQVVVIGSGATAVTLVPALAEQAAHVTMLQRSPSYIVARPSEDRLANWMREHLPGKVAYSITRWRAILFMIYFYALARRRPDFTKRAIVRMARDELPPDFDVDTHFSPRYNPWDQRLCLAPDADLFAAIRDGNVSVVTDDIETFTENGVQLRSGEELPADIIVTATGLTMMLMSGVRLVVDGRAVDLGETLSYRGMMYSGVPNLASSFGYTNASWTLKCELISRYVCRLLRYMDQHGYGECVAERPALTGKETPAINLSSGYVQRALDRLPRQGAEKPWRTYQNYLRDIVNLRLDPINDGTLTFTQGGTRVPKEVEASRAS
jgi:cation diffusion facilitator CzcD-associated flavoprotein CzcO